MRSQGYKRDGSEILSANPEVRSPRTDPRVRQDHRVTTINGLPAHILIVHLVVVGVPLAALLTVLSGVWPAARRRLGIVTPVVALVALISVPLAMNAGEWLRDRVFATDLIRTHTGLGEDLLPWAIGLFVAALLPWLLPRLARSNRRVQTWLVPAAWIGMGVLAVGFAAVSVIQVVRIGDSGSKAAWTGQVCAQPYVNGSCPNNQFLK